MVMEEQDLDMELASERIPVPTVQEASKSAEIKTSNKVSNIPRVKPRLRKKALHAAILKQMEFYFSDANLSKDRFLSNIIYEDPNVDLNIFTTFNKIRELTTDMSRIAKALHGSTMLSVSEDGRTVCRVTPIKQKENMEECMVYVQNLPPDSDHEWLASLFSYYGTVVYVSIPRYKSNRKIKGFAFVEYDTPEAAAKCIESFQKKGCVLPLYTSPELILSIQTFDQTEKDVTLECQLLKSKCGNTDLNRNNDMMDVTNDTSQGCNTEIVDKQEEDTVHTNQEGTPGVPNADFKSGKKRKHRNSDATCEVLPQKIFKSEEIDQKSDADVNPRLKKHKHSNDSELGNDTNAQNENFQTHTSTDSKETEDDQMDASLINIENNVMKLPNDSVEDNQDAADNVEPMNTTKEEKCKDSDQKKEGKKRKRKRRGKGEDISGSMGLQVMMKRDWKHLRNKYLELQRSKMKQLKQHLKKARMNQWSTYERSKPPREETDQKEQVVAVNTSRNFAFTPGTIVKIEMSECCVDPKNFKSELKGNSFIKYIDVSEGSYEAYVRCETPESAQTFAQKSTNERHMEVLQGDEERAYLDKILQDREEKLGNKIRCKQRGRDKLLKRAEKALGKHIKFDEV